MKVCSNCFLDVELVSFINSNSTIKGKCDYCNNDINTDLLDISELLDFFSEFFDIFIKAENGVVLTDIISNDWNLFSNNSNDHKLLSDILKNIGSEILNPNQKVNYSTDINECTLYWDKLKEDLKWEKRFLIDVEEIKQLGLNRYLDIKTTEGFYRARLHKIEGEEKFPINKMGSPNREKASGGRANPKGIPYLYLCKSLKTTLYEARATYFDEISIGKFMINEDSTIKLVDFTEDRASAFEVYANDESIKEYAKIVKRKKHISLDLSKPLRRYDSELDYVPTQLICEYFRRFTEADGVLFNSSLHQEGKNIVLFKENKVKCVSVEKYQVTNIKIESGVI